MKKLTITRKNNSTLSKRKSKRNKQNINNIKRKLRTQNGGAGGGRKLKSKEEMQALDAEIIKTYEQQKQKNQVPTDSIAAPNNSKPPRRTLPKRLPNNTQPQPHQLSVPSTSTSTSTTQTRRTLPIRPPQKNTAKPFNSTALRNIGTPLSDSKLFMNQNSLSLQIPFQQNKAKTSHKKTFSLLNNDIFSNFNLRNDNLQLELPPEVEPDKPSIKKTRFIEGKDKYFQQQESSACGRHALNNLFGGEVFVKTTNPPTRFDNVKDNLKTFNLSNKKGKQFPLNDFCLYLNRHDASKDNKVNGPCPYYENYEIQIMTEALKIMGYNMDTVKLETGDCDPDVNYNEQDFIGYIANISEHWIAYKHVGNCMLYYIDSRDSSTRRKIEQSYLLDNIANYNISLLFRVSWNGNYQAPIDITYLKQEKQKQIKQEELDKVLQNSEQEELDKVLQISEQEELDKVLQFSKQEADKRNAQDKINLGRTFNFSTNKADTTNNKRNVGKHPESESHNIYNLSNNLWEPAQASATYKLSNPNAKANFIKEQRQPLPAQIMKNNYVHNYMPHFPSSASSKLSNALLEDNSTIPVEYNQGTAIQNFTNTFNALLRNPHTPINPSNKEQIKQLRDLITPAAFTNEQLVDLTKIITTSPKLAKNHLDKQIIINILIEYSDTFINLIKENEVANFINYLRILV